MMRFAFIFVALALFVIVGGILEETVPEEMWDKFGHLLRLD